MFDTVLDLWIIARVILNDRMILSIHFTG
jgi:hypothetical protein